jgi:hypothetical protein
MLQTLIRWAKYLAPAFEGWRSRVVTVVVPAVSGYWARAAAFIASRDLEALNASTKYPYDWAAGAFVLFICVALFLALRIIKLETQKEPHLMLKLDRNSPIPTALVDGFDLRWMHKGFGEPIELRSDSPEYLDIFSIDENTNVVSPVVRHGSAATLAQFNSPGTYKFNVVVSEESGARCEMSITIRQGDTWEQFDVSALSKPLMASRNAGVNS